MLLGFVFKISSVLPVPVREDIYQIMPHNKQFKINKLRETRFLSLNVTKPGARLLYK